MDNAFRIVNFLGKNIGESSTMHEVSIKTEIPYATFHRTIQDMSKFHMIKEKEVGHSKAITLNLENPSIKAYLTIGSIIDAEDFLKGRPLFKKIVSELPDDKGVYRESVLLFGSYAKGEYTDKSDIDILVLNRKGAKSLSFSKYELLFKKKINPIFFTEQEFKQMLKEKEENVGKQVLKNHIVLKNPSYFWDMVLNAIR